jgi:flavin-dependent dehydrogenase
MLDVLIAGAGPAGSIAAIVLARAGARVLLIDRETFPRDKLCGDTLNPGAIRLLSSLRLADGPLAAARPLAGMLMSGPRATARARYPAGVVGRAIRRREFDAWLLDHAIRAGARFEDGWIARKPLIEESRGAWRVRGLVLDRRAPGRGELRLPASMVIAADGRRSAVARALGLIEHPKRPRRWAFGGYATGIAGTSDLGEMHVRCGYYLGIAPLDDAVCNVCLVTGPRPEGSTPVDVIRRAIARERALAPRFAAASFAGPIRVLGPLAADARAAGAPGLLLAGDAAGFVDPMTGDGLHLAMQSAVLAAAEALRALETGDIAAAIDRLSRAREDELGKKLRFNRALRRLVDSRTAISLAEWGARLNPRALDRVVSYAGDAA